MRQIAEAEGQATRIAGRLAELEREVEAQGKAIDLDHLKATLAEFDAIWDVLEPHERGPVMQSLLSTISCHEGREIQLAFNGMPSL